MSIVRRSVLVVAWVALNLLVLEAATRAWFVVSVGPRVLLYGTPWHRYVPPPPPAGGARDPFAASVQSHHNDVGEYEAYAAGARSYSKYFPRETKWTESPDRTQRYPVRINNQGFRGADFTIEKPPGTIRILTLGASSTFGYHDRDDETYPFLLQGELQRTAEPGQRFEVINFAIPHATTDNVLAMFAAEGLALSPDVVTFYEGANDGATIEARDGAAQASWRDALVARSLLAAFADRIVPRSEAADAEWWWSDELARRRSRAFVGNLQRLADLCRDRGIRLIVATQQLNSMLVPEAQRRGLTYAAELAMVREKVARGEIGPRAVSVPEMAFRQRLTGNDALALRTLARINPARVMLIHARLMDDLRAWAPGAGVGFVDTSHILDRDRHLMVNWVHLRPEANAMIAGALATAVRDQLGVRAATHAPPPTVATQ